MDPENRLMFAWDWRWEPGFAAENTRDCIWEKNVFKT